VKLDTSRHAVDAVLADAARTGISISAGPLIGRERGAHLSTPTGEAIVFYSPHGYTPFETVRLANEIQDFVVEHVLWASGRDPVWPNCPLHPDTHPLDPVEDAAVGPAWRCPKDGTIARIGELGLVA